MWNGRRMARKEYSDRQYADYMCQLFAEQNKQDGMDGLLWKIGLLCVVLVIAAIFVICRPAHAFTCSASYYTVASCEAESGQHTMANGKELNDNLYTVASWDYPFGTKLAISANGRTVVVTVSDRGPAKRLYRAGRKIDLSRAAYQKLAPLSTGIITVEVKKI